MSAMTTPNDSPISAPIQPMHNPSQAAKVVVPQAPLGSATNVAASVAPGMGMKALLAKKMAKGNNPQFISPTDNMMTPVTQKLTAAKQKRFTNGAKPIGPLFKAKDSYSSDEQEDHSSDAEQSETKTTDMRMDEDENPF